MSAHSRGHRPAARSLSRARASRNATVRKMRFEVLEPRLALATTSSNLVDRALDHFDDSTGRNGLAIFNLTTGEATTIGGDAVFGTSSTIKLGVLYALLRRVDSDPNVDLTTTLNVGLQYGNNQGNTLTANTAYTLDTLARTMIENSNNWATNRLMDFIGINQINQEFADLGLTNTRIQRYNTGTGSPSAQGLSDPGDDYRAGFDNETTPNEIVSLLRQIHTNNGLLSAPSYADYWTILNLNNDDGGSPEDYLSRTYAQSIFNNTNTNSWDDLIEFSRKNGSNTWNGSPGDFVDDPTLGDHFQRSEAGRIEFSNGEIVFYGAFVDEAANGDSAIEALANVGYEIAVEYAGAPVTLTPLGAELDDGRVITTSGTALADQLAWILSTAAPERVDITVNGTLIYELDTITTPVNLARVLAGDGDDRFVMTGGLAAPGLTMLRLEGQGGNDEFHLRPSAVAAIEVHGGAPEQGEPGVPPGDILAVDFSGVAGPVAPFTTPNGTIIGTNVQSLNFTSIETLIVSDAFEDNDSILTASLLGSMPEVLLPNLSIDSADDEDFYKITANRTGSLYINAFFDHDIGDLDLQVLDLAGNLIASSTSTDDDEQIIIPVVTQQSYYIRVFGINDDVNTYTLEIENFAAPVPTGVHLDPADDTGMMNNDNVTSETRPRIFIQTDVLEFVDSNGSGLFEQGDDRITALNPGADGMFDSPVDEPFEDGNEAGIAVEVTFVNTSNPLAPPVTGFARPVVDASPEVYEFTPTTPLAPGVYFITARTKVFDGQDTNPSLPGFQRAMGRSNASPPLWLTIDSGANGAEMISAEMLASSDSGMFNDDHVTNKMQPAFHGVAPAGSKVRLFANGQLVGQTIAGSDTSDDLAGPIGGIGGEPDDGLGLWEITVEPLVDGAYDVTLEIEDAAGNVVVADPQFNAEVDPQIDIVIDTVEPNTPLLDLLDDSGRSSVDNVTNDSTPRVSMTTTDPNATLAQLLYADNLKFRIFDRYQSGAQEVLIYDSAQDAAADAIASPGDMFTVLTQITRSLPVLTPPSTAIVGGALAPGVHNLKLEVEDRAGNISHDFFLEITVDTAAPPVSFGLPDIASEIDGLTAASDSGVTTNSASFADRITSDTTPTIWGRAEANSIVRLYLDRNNNGVIDLATDTFLGQSVANPFDGNDAYPDGYWEITSALDLNQLVGIPKDGVRRLLVTAEDLAGNPLPASGTITSGVDELQIFLDTQGPRISSVTINNLTADEYDLFDPKPSQTGFTPLVENLRFTIEDFPARIDQAGMVNDFLHDALQAEIASSPGNYVLVGDHVGIIPIQTVTVLNLPATNSPAAATVALSFFEPLPDDRYTLTISDNLVDPAGNKLDGESNAAEPQESPLFPSGDGVPGGKFIARFTIDSRPEIGSYVSQDIDLDINGNFIWDPPSAPVGTDATNVDLSFTLPVRNTDGTIGLGGFNVHDLLLVGRFRGNQNPPNGDEGSAVAAGGLLTARYFDQLAAFGFSAELGAFRWIVDTDSDGVVSIASDILTIQPTGGINGFNVSGAVPVAGNFDGNAANGDEIGLYHAGRWAFDTNRNFIIDGGDTFVTTTLLGHPIVGDFDGDERDDLAVFNNNIFTFNLANDGFLDGADTSFVWGFPGVLDRPVAADIDQDGIDDIGLWIPRTSASLPKEIAEWHFLISNDRTRQRRLTGAVNTINHPFTVEPFGNDIFAEFGDSRALPIVGNFDPPIAPDAEPAPTIPGDYDRNGRVENTDYLVWKSSFGSRTHLAADGNGNGRIDAADYSIWRDNLGAIAQSATGAQAASLETWTAPPDSAVPPTDPSQASSGWESRQRNVPPASDSTFRSPPANTASRDFALERMSQSLLMTTLGSHSTQRAGVEEFADASAAARSKDDLPEEFDFSSTLVDELFGQF